MNIDTAIADFINYCIFEKGLSDTTKESYGYDLNTYKDFLYTSSIASCILSTPKSLLSIYPTFLLVTDV